ncbi:calcium-binding protein [Rhizobium alvei]|uniref:Calcium-binding protein n=1 Tax=Rhizobium alvei TaxID=1132659 RepID=A0ABT8YGD4_9HYPH|nr:calcium-binding protein [Rhizobium alvei]MDO6962730.1 calcium-binding protein [Rhizobium alvei]
MAKIIISEDRETTFKAYKANTDFVLAENVDIVVAGKDYGINATSDHENRNLDIRGNINASLSEGIAIAIGNPSGLGGGNAVIQKSANISGYYGITNYANGQTITNHGAISGMVGIATMSDRGRVINDGTISVVGYGISLGGAQRVVNDGKITGGEFGISAAGYSSERAVIVNHGEITGGEMGIMSGGETGTRLEIINTGKITGTTSAIHVFEGLTTQIVRNRGELSGGVYLGGGNDVFDGRGGTVGDQVAGGDNNDTYIIDNGLTTLYETANGGLDTVRSAVSWTLGDNFENLALIGKNDLSATGNALANKLSGNIGANKLFGMDGMDVLIGGAGNDKLTGGAQMDLFVFRQNFDKDHITDFTDGLDQIDLRTFDGIDSYDDVSGHMKQEGSNVVIRFGHGDVLFIDNEQLADIGSDDFLFG